MLNLIEIDNYPVKDVLKILLQDKTTGKNIIFATDMYSDYGYSERNPMTETAITGLCSFEIQPRVCKAQSEQNLRTRKKAEVFTPTWICNMMNNHLDSDWFGRDDVFNRMDNEHNITATEEPVAFSGKKTWQKYVDSRRLEITCGEAPYLVSRYDTTTGEPIPIKERIGLLDRKLRIVGENTTSEDDWLFWAIRAFQSIYGYEFQGDNILIARINLLVTFCDYLEDKWHRKATKEEIKKLANIIAWNIWQMDGLTDTVPIGAPKEQYTQMSLLDSEEPATPVDCRIQDWRDKRPKVFKKINGKNERGVTMKFDYVIGNPPYQEEDGGAQASARPIYHYFLEAGIQISQNVELIMPTRWYAGGKGLDEFRDRMLNEKHIKSLHDYPHTDEVFPGVNIRGGVCILSWSNSYDSEKNKTNVFTHIGNSTEVSKRSLKYSNLDIFIRYSKAISILDKVVKEENFCTISDYVSSRKPFGLATNFNSDSKFRTDKSNMSNPVMCYYKGLKTGYIECSDIPSHKEWVGVWKVMTSRANNIGTELNDDNLNAFVIEPNTVCTESYMIIGAELNLDESKANNLVIYFKTKFARFLHSLAKASQDATSKTYRFVPIQNFSLDSDINWSLSIPEIDQQLYKKYGLSQEEIDFIESHVKEMT